jgi:tetratricopeptide (TPR) repeat protein
MNLSRTPQWIVITLALAMTTALSAAAETGKPIAFSTKDLSGTELAVPAPDGVTVLLFVRARQPQSQQAIEAVGKASEARPDARVIVVVSGVDAAADAKKIFESLAFDWPVVADPDYALSGKASVRVWPTTAIVKPSGEEASHLAGLTKAFESDFAAHLDRAMGIISDDQLKQKLEDRAVVTDQPHHIAQRHGMVAKRMIDKADYAAARAELESGLKLAPEEASLKLLLAEVLIHLNQPAEAKALLDSIKPGPVPAWQLDVMRAKVHIALGQWEQARALLAEAVKLNPNPAEAYYLIGLVHDQAKDSAAAAEAYRKAYESLAKSRS